MFLTSYIPYAFHHFYRRRTQEATKVAESGVYCSSLARDAYVAIQFIYSRNLTLLVPTFYEITNKV